MGAIQSLLQRIGNGFRSLFGTGSSGYLCDRCKWDYGDACSRPERPNARTCPDFRARR